MPVDPAPFLSTVILASAALVAIVGGLLVARFVGLDSDQQTSRKLLADAENRLAIATRRAEQARQDLIHWHVTDFLDNDDVADALVAGEVDVKELRKLARTRLSDDQLRGMAALAAAEAASFREWLAQEQVLRLIRETEYDWREFRRASGDMPILGYPQLMRPVFEGLARRLATQDAEEDRRRAEEEERRRAEEERRRAETLENQARRYGLGGIGGLAGLGSSFKIADSFAGLGQMRQVADIGLNSPHNRRIAALVPRPQNAALIVANRYDDLVAADVRARQRVEDLQDELRRLSQQHADVIRPDVRLWWAVVILVAYAIAGVAVPLWVMSQGPASLQAVHWTFWPFAAGMVVLLAYIAVYLFGLTRRRRKWAADAGQTASTGAVAIPRDTAGSDTLTPSATADGPAAESAGQPPPVASSPADLEREGAEGS